MVTRKQIALLLLTMPHHVEMTFHEKENAEWKMVTTLHRRQEKVLADEKKRRPL